MEYTIRVAAASQPSAVAGAIAALVRRHCWAEVQAIGANAVNQMMKAAIIAQHYLEEDGLSLTMVPSFVMVEIQGQERTAVRLQVQGSRSGTSPSADEDAADYAGRRSYQPAEHPMQGKAI